MGRFRAVAPFSLSDDSCRMVDGSVKWAERIGKEGMRMSTMIEIIGVLREDVASDEDRWMDSKSGWNHGIPGGAHAAVLDAISSNNNFSELPDAFVRRRCTTFSVVEKSRDSFQVWRKEEALERFIVATNSRPEKNNKTSIHNQYCVAQGKESVDLIVSDNGNMSEYVELKNDAGGGTPVYAIIELLKNLELTRMANKSLPKTLRLLAPKKYFEGFYREVSVQKFLDFCRDLGEESEVEITISYVDVNFADLSTQVHNFVSGKHGELLWQPYTGKAVPPAYIQRASVDATNIVDIHQNIWQKLQREQWLQINSANSWPRG